MIGPRSGSAEPEPLVLVQRPSHYKAWTEAKLFEAYKAYLSGMSVRKAAEIYGVPKSTLSDRVSGRVAFGARSGPSTYLSDDEEFELVQFLTHCATVGYAKSKHDILAIVRNVVLSKGLANATVTDGWWSSVKRLHGVLTLQTVEQLSYTRAVSSSPQIISCYFDLLEETTEKNDLMDKPAQIFNLDETGMPLDPKPPKVVTVRGAKHAATVSTGSKSQITVLSCCNAAGYVIPPLVIFKQKVTPELAFGEAPGTVYGQSKSGWMTMEIFNDWFDKHFLAYAPPARPLLLLMDGHSSHYCPQVINRALQEKVILFCLPPNTTHLTQPLDKGCFGPLKVAWRQKCKDFLQKNPGRVVTKYDFSRLFGQAWMTSMSMPNTVAGFRCTGIYPFNRSAFLPESVSHATSVAEKYGLNFVPTYSPTRPKLVS